MFSLLFYINITDIIILVNTNRASQFSYGNIEIIIHFPNKNLNLNNQSKLSEVKFTLN